MKNSHIEWTDHTFNPWEGCTKVSPGCAHCYAEARDKRFTGGIHWGKGAPRRRTSVQNWNQPKKWNREALRFECSRCQFVAIDPDNIGDPYMCPNCKIALPQSRRPRVFCASLADWLDDEVPIEWLADLLDLIRQTSNLDWLLLTKRPENWKARIHAVGQLFNQRSFAGAPHDEALRQTCLLAQSWDEGTPPANVQIGVSVENEEVCYKRVLALIHIPARVRFLSCEPLLSMVDIEWIFDPTGYVSCGGEPECSCQGCKDCSNWPRGEDGAFERIHWVICGGESGKDARPMHPDWARSLRDQCQTAGAAFFFKQWGEWVSHPVSNATYPPGTPVPAEDQPMRLERVGKLKAGRLLDGKKHNEFPEVTR